MLQNSRNSTRKGLPIKAQHSCCLWNTEVNDFSRSFSSQIGREDSWNGDLVICAHGLFLVSLLLWNRIWCLAIWRKRRQQGQCVPHRWKTNINSKGKWALPWRPVTPHPKRMPFQNPEANCSNWDKESRNASRIFPASSTKLASQGHWVPLGLQTQHTAAMYDMPAFSGRCQPQKWWWQS